MSRSEAKSRVKPGLYIHIPYCASKCVYCSFNSCVTSCGVPADYVGALVRDIERSAPEWVGIEFGSVYFGGGTPSLLDPADLERVLRGLRAGFSIAAGAEVTLEANPSSVSLPGLLAYRSLGINRLSVGVQSLEAGELRLLGRLHSPEQALGALERARAAGFTNVSSDVMVGVPGQNASSLAETLRRMAPVVDHISCYLLSVDQGTPLYDLVRGGAVEEAEEEDMADLYETVERELACLGFARYEVSNWARPGSESRHNLMYWARGEYLGLGAGASSHRRGRRCRRLDSPGAYVEAALSGGDPVCFRERLTEQGVLDEEVMLRLRTARGLDLGWLAGEYGCDIAAADFLLERFCSDGLIVRNREEIRLSPKGIMVSDAIIEELTSALSVSVAISY